jgi:hypothetical protein
MSDAILKAREMKEFSEKFSDKISPSKILKYFYPMDANIDELVLKRAGARGNVIHNRIEHALLGKDVTNEDQLQNYDKLEESDFPKIETLWQSFMSEDLLQFENYALETKIETSTVRGIIDYLGYYDGKLSIIDWKTNSGTFKEGGEELEKFTLQLNIYRLMVKAILKVDIEDLYIFHITPNKTKNRVKKYKCELLEDQEVISKIKEVYDYYENEKAINGELTKQPEPIAPMIATREEVVQQQPELQDAPTNAGFKIESKVNDKKNKLIMVMGEPKSGKTTFVNTLTDNKILFIECGYDNGYGVLGENVDFIVGQVTNDIPNKVHSGAKLLSILKEINQNLEEYAKTYEWLVIDPFNNIEEDVKTFIEEIKGKQMSMQEWGIIGKVYEQLKSEIMKINTKINICLLTHVKSLDHTDDLSGTQSVTIIPMMTENNGKKFTKVADMIGFTCIAKNANNELDYKIIIGGHATLPTGTRTATGVQIPNDPITPDYKKISKAVWGL